jgi:hypothetical protein
MGYSDAFAVPGVMLIIAAGFIMFTRKGQCASAHQDHRHW